MYPNYMMGAKSGYRGPLLSEKVVKETAMCHGYRRNNCIFAAMKPTVVLHHLCIGYQGGRHVHPIAPAIDASLYEGELTCLIGPNGVGKSTLLRTLSAFLPPLSGQVLIEKDARQIDITSCSLRQLSHLLSIVLTSRPDVSNLRVNEVVGMGRSPYTDFWGKLSANDEQVVEESLGMVGVAQLRKRSLGTLSDGECQKVMIAKALAQQTPIILLDEPTAFLDYPSRVEMLQTLRRLAHQLHKTILLSTHDVELALQLADRLWLMQSDGLTIGSARELADSGALARFIERPGIAFDTQHLSIRVEPLVTNN